MSDLADAHSRPPFVDVLHNERGLGNRVFNRSHFLCTPSTSRILLKLERTIIVFAAAIVAGAINSIAGGGTLVSFPALIWAGLDPIVANATNTVAISPGALAAMFGLRNRLLR